MLDRIEKLYNKNSEIYIRSSPKLVKVALEHFAARCAEKSRVSDELGIDPSGLRRWCRTGILPLSIFLKLKLSGIDMESLRNHIKFVTAPKSFHKVRIPKLNGNIAYLVGYISGDGHLKDPQANDKKWEIIVESWTDTSELLMLNKILFKNFNIKGSIIRNRGRKGSRLFINSKILHRLLTQIFNIPVGKKSDIMSVPLLIRKGDEPIKKGYIQGWFDAEGFVTQSHKRPQVEFYIKSDNVTNWIKTELENHGIKVYKNYRGTLIIRKKQIMKFASVIGFKHRKQLKKLASNTASGNTRGPNGDHDYWV